MDNLNGVVFKGVMTDIDFFKAMSDASVLWASCGDIIAVQCNYKMCEYCGHKQYSMIQCPKCNSIRISEECDIILYIFTGDEWIQMENYTSSPMDNKYVHVNGNNNEFDDKGFFNDDTEYLNSSKNIFTRIINFLKGIIGKSNKKQYNKNKKDNLIIELYE